MTVQVGGGYYEKEQEKQARMPILLPQFNGILEVGLLEWTVQCIIILYTTYGLKSFYFDVQYLISFQVTQVIKDMEDNPWDYVYQVHVPNMKLLML